MKSEIGFILYDSRSGSTMLSDMLEKFEHVFVTNESAFISRLFSLTDLTKHLEVVQYLFEEPQFADLGLSKEETLRLLERSGSDLRAFAELVVLTHLKKRYEWFQDTEGQLIVVKHPPSHHLRKFEQSWPKAKAIIFVRDGRDVSVSKMRGYNLDNEPFSRNIFSSAMNWKYRYRLFPTTIWDSVTVRYEDIIRGTAEVSALLRAFGIADVETDRSDKKFPVPESHRGFHKNVGSSILKNNAKKFAKDGYINFVYSLTNGSLLLQFGYDDVVPFKWWRIKHTVRFLSEVFMFSTRSLARALKYSFTDRHRFLIAFHKISNGLGFSSKNH